MSDERKTSNGLKVDDVGDMYDEAVPEMRHVKLSKPSALSNPKILHDKSPNPWVGGPLPKPLTSRAESVTMEREWTGKILASTWNVQPECLELVPIDFPLERTHREIHGSNASEVADRITEALKKLSIEAKFCGKTAKAKCKTEDFIEFRIRLFSGGEGSQPVIVELQRRTGAVRSFMCTCRCILLAAEGKEFCETKVTSSRIPPNISSMKCLKGVNLVCDPISDCTKALQNIMNLLRDKRFDTNLLGLENLCILTDPLKTPLKTVEFACKSVVVGQNSYCLRDDILLVVERSGECVRDTDLKGLDYQDRIKSLSLKVFSLSLNVMAKNHDLEDAVQKDTWFCEILLPMLFVEIKQARESPLRACVAISCILSMCFTKLKTVILDMDGLSSVLMAQEIGEKCHELLATEARRCVKCLEVGSD